MFDRETHAMIIAIHRGKTLIMEYNYKNTDCVEMWSFYKAWLIV